MGPGLSKSSFYFEIHITRTTRRKFERISSRHMESQSKPLLNMILKHLRDVYLKIDELLNSMFIFFDGFQLF